MSLPNVILLYDFNPHSHKGSDFQVNSSFLFIWISIHTPTKGATFSATTDLLISVYFNPHSHKGSDTFNIVFLFIIFISIHTPTKGATVNCLCQPCLLSISIHTPTKGATGRYYNTARGQENFNPHSHKGSDDNFVVTFIPSSKFQSTLPQRERLPINAIFIANISFQSTLPQRERQRRICR